MITIDGSFGEGGGQILRTSLSLSLATGQPFRIAKIRAGRKKPGLLRQHLTAVKAAGEISGAKADGDRIGSTELVFEPGPVRAGDYRFAVGTAGSATLVLQTVLPALATAEGASTLQLEGGTHNPYAPPFDFLQKVYLPLLQRMGPEVTAELERPGFYPAGGGCFAVRVQPSASLVRLALMERGEIRERRAVALMSQLSSRIGERELKVLQEELSWPEEALRGEEVARPRGPGNVLLAEVVSEQLTEVFTGFGQQGVVAELVAGTVVKAVREYLASGVPVGRHLADQLMVPMALAGGGEFMTLPPTRHALTNMEVLKAFLDIETTVEKVNHLAWHVRLDGR